MLQHYLQIQALATPPLARPTHEEQYPCRQGERPQGGQLKLKHTKAAIHHQQSDFTRVPTFHSFSTWVQIFTSTVTGTPTLMVLTSTPTLTQQQYPDILRIEHHRLGNCSFRKYSQSSLSLKKTMILGVADHQLFINIPPSHSHKAHIQSCAPSIKKNNAFPLQCHKQMLLPYRNGKIRMLTKGEKK